MVDTLSNVSYKMRKPWISSSDTFWLGLLIRLACRAMDACTQKMFSKLWWSRQFSQKLEGTTKDRSRSSSPSSDSMRSSFKFWEIFNGSLRILKLSIYLSMLFNILSLFCLKLLATIPIYRAFTLCLAVHIILTLENSFSIANSNIETTVRRRLSIELRNPLDFNASCWNSLITTYSIWTYLEI